MNPTDRARLLELLADEHFNQLAPEDRAQLEALRAQAPDAEALAQLPAKLLLTLDQAQTSAAQTAANPGSVSPLPASLRDKLIVQGQQLSAPAERMRIGSAADKPRTSTAKVWLALAAGLALAGATVAISVSTIRSRDQELAASSVALLKSKAELEALAQRVRSNDEALASARAAAEKLTAELQTASATVDASKRQLAEAAAKEVELAQRLALATSDLDQARLALVKYETPVDPVTLAQNRTKLLEVPGTVRLAWKPFDLPDSPAEQRTVQGDVVWNDETQTGFLRFVNLAVNDPKTEQYQVWIIDERGLEQKVGGGVFNASAAGEVIVPIHPGIDVGKVALFAITIENPGGTWVPDLKRRVVVAPRSEG
jgi:hypothetical protein